MHKAQVQRKRGRPKNHGPGSLDLRIGNKIRIQRALKGWSQQKLGDFIGITFQQVQKYERGLNKISAARLHQVAQILSTPVDYFYSEELHPPAVSYGFSENDSAQYTNDNSSQEVDHLPSREALKLGHYFQNIQDPKVRKSILQMTKALALQYGAKDLGDDDADDPTVSE